MIRAVRRLLYRLFTHLAGLCAPSGVIHPSGAPPYPANSPEEIIAMFIADFQPALDKLNSLPADIAASRAAAVAAAVATATTGMHTAQDVADTVATIEASAVTAVTAAQATS